MFKFVYNNKYLKTTRQSLRNNLTKEETILWNHLKNNKLGYKFRRQHSIGQFIADFYCAEKKLAIELDGSQHLDNREYDKERTEYFESLDVRVVRFWNSEVNNNIEGVVMRVKSELVTSPK